MGFDPYFDYGGDMADERTMTVKRKPGRPKTDDPRTMRVKMSGAEWARCVEQARKAGAKSTAAWVRERCGL